MTVNVSASVNFEAATLDEANAEVASWGLPEGATVMVAATEQLTSGIVEGGVITPPTDSPPDPPVLD